MFDSDGRECDIHFISILSSLPGVLAIFGTFPRFESAVVNFGCNSELVIQNFQLIDVVFLFMLQGVKESLVLSFLFLQFLLA